MEGVTPPFGPRDDTYQAAWARPRGNEGQNTPFAVTAARSCVHATQETYNHGYTYTHIFL